MLTQNVLGNGPGLNRFMPLGCLLSRPMDNLDLAAALLTWQQKASVGFLKKRTKPFFSPHSHPRPYCTGGHPKPSPTRSRLTLKAIVGDMSPSALSLIAVAHKEERKHKEQKLGGMCGAETL